MSELSLFEKKNDRRDIDLIIYVVFIDVNNQMRFLRHYLIMINHENFVVSDYDDERENSSKNIKKNAKFQLDEISIENDCISSFQFMQKT
jgi:hypothetical protein